MMHIHSLDEDFKNPQLKEEYTESDGIPDTMIFQATHFYGVGTFRTWSLCLSMTLI